MDTAEASTTLPNKPESVVYRHRAPMWLGVIAGLVAALGYTAASAFLRALSSDVDSVWVCTIKALCTFSIFTPWLLYLVSQGKNVMPKPKTIGVMVFAGVVVQVGGNVGLQVALGVIGLALTIPIVMGSMVVFTALIGKATLHEKVSARLWVSLCILILSICLLSAGVQAVSPDGDNSQPVVNPVPVWLAVASACISGLSFSILGIAIRWTTRSSHVPLATPMVIVGFCGVVTLGIWTWISKGPEIVAETTNQQWSMMWMASISNSLAFLALTYALRVLPVIYVNAINVTQVGMAAVLGVLLFHEQISSFLIIGLFLMISALLSMRGSNISVKKPEDS